MQETEQKKVIFSGIQPSGDLTLGNYLGALKNWVKLQDQYECYYCIVDMHAITVKQQPKDLRRRTLELLSIYVAAGIDPEKNTIFIQSHVPAHAEATWILNCNSYMGELSRMTQYKDKSQKYGNNIGVGLFTYPVLMAADILLYQTDLVPVGKDQKQHLELTRDIAERFNGAYSPTFKVPEPYIPEAGAKIMDLQEPSKKMSKSSDNPNSFILIMDPPEVIRKKISRAVTDSLGVVKYSDEQPGVKNLMTILSVIKGKSFEDIEKEYEGQGYAKFKKDVAEAIVEELTPIQEKVKELVSNKEYLESIYIKGAEKANYIATKTLRKMQKKIGFIPR
ncbi:tryptophan--tRNA ligase [Clostridium botulinum]|uniref:Tryptophan--tRNA ligase n=1 Tax=Clostridium botulinum TaxID=1491 RepID=A0A9Q1ZE61_CLOBO|nr:tryptophan--tRNA ligase [Clostridium botulinum]AEB75201.1 tryptophan--tRNA ligase [Clostridium botulinum BKT015925]KEI03342.1 tryptophanyl-tRNA synthetase [Clostridium botulinum D str. 16868]KEI05418.1 tryptophanyl-tRNA synthetase [Clostridium botulinum C/D str. Sp77]KLU75175.1 tryptophanyl-tRNA synthetase [Clostridium botulinum V891]KOA73346.1 tryptophanyl-tRNA synthetase [Clostridium botulinum]